MRDSQRNGLIVLIVVVTIISAGVLYLVYSDPVDEYKGIPDLEPYITDEVGVLDYDDLYDLEGFCAEVEQNNSCQVALLITNDTGYYDLYSFAVKTFQKNGVGQEGQDNGVLVVFLVRNSSISWQTVPGSGVNTIISGFVLKGFENTYLIPTLQEGDVSEGIKLYLYAIGLELVDNYVGEGTDFWNSHPIDFLPLNGWQLTLVLIVIVVIGVATRGRVFLWLIYLVLSLIRGGGGFGGGRTGGGGSRGRF